MPISIQVIFQFHSIKGIVEYESLGVSASQSVGCAHIIVAGITVGIVRSHVAGSYFDFIVAISHISSSGNISSFMLFITPSGTEVISIIAGIPEGSGIIVFLETEGAPTGTGELGDLASITGESLDSTDHGSSICMYH